MSAVQLAAQKFVANPYIVHQILDCLEDGEQAIQRIVLRVDRISCQELVDTLEQMVKEGLILYLNSIASYQISWYGITKLQELRENYL